MIHETIKTRVVGVDIQIDTTTLAVIDVRGNIIASESFNTGTNPNIGERNIVPSVALAPMEARSLASL